MNIKNIIIAVIALSASLAAQAFTVGGINYNIIDSRNHLVEIAPPSGDTPYTGLTTDKLKTSVSSGGVTYTVVGIGPEAFANATWDNTLQLPEGYLYIDASAFTGAEGLSVKIAASVQAIAPNAFAGNKLHGITVVTTNEKYAHLSHSTNADGSFVFLTNKEKTAILAAPGARAKNYSGGGTTYVRTLSIPEQITEIGPYVFYRNAHLTSIKLHSGITKYGLAAFYHSALTSINIPNGEAEFGNALFAESDKLTTATLPQGMKELPASAFYCCEALSTINLPEGLVKLGKMSLSSTALSSVNLPSTLEVLDTCALQWTLISKIDLKNVKVIKNQAFSHCENLTTITGGEQLEELGSTVFTACNKLTSAQIPANVKRMVGGSYFRCTGLTEATIPATMEYIERNPFVGCTSLPRVKVAEGCTHFAELDSCLYEIVDGKPYRLVTLPSARANKVMYLRPGTQVISAQAMREVAITGFTADKALKQIEPSAFSSCRDLTMVKVLAAVPPTGADFAEEAYANATLYVPKKSVDAYKAAEGWKEFQNIVGVDVPDEGSKGDVNGDGNIDVDDMNILINDMLNGIVRDLNTEDMNGDGTVDVDDLNAIINIILG